MSLKIDILCSDGSPIGICPDCLWGDDFRVGVGGSEYALLTMCELWSEKGYTIRLYNTPHKYKNEKFEQFPKDSFNPLDERDVLITFRTPNPASIIANGMKVWWSCDQYTSENFKEFAPYMDKIVCISSYHSDYFQNHYDIKNTIPIDLAIRLQDFAEYTPIPNRLIFTSVPDRGLHHLIRLYPKIKNQIPDLSLVITSDYRLWGSAALNERHRSGWSMQPDVLFLGAINRQKYINELLRADFLLYPCIYEELFCIAVAEAECCGIYPFTTNRGALRTTTLGIISEVDADDSRNDWVFIDKTIELLSHRSELESKKAEIIRKSRERFSPVTILKQWDEKVFNGT